MSAEEIAERIGAGLSPEGLRESILALARRRRTDAESGVAKCRIVDELLAGRDLGTGPEAWSAELRIKRAIRDAVAQIPDVTYGEGDA